MDIRRYWADVRRVEETLPAPTNPPTIIYLTSLDNADKGTTAGMVCDMIDRTAAARRLVEGTHRLSTPDEVIQHEARQKAQVEELAAIEIKRKQQFALPQELQTLVAAAAQSMLDRQQDSRPQTPRQPR